MITEHLRVAQSSVDIGDPHICSDSINRNSLIRAIYEPLIIRTGPGTFSSTLAKDWAIEPDGLTWSFRIRQGVTFHNGDVLSSKDVVSSLKRIIDPFLGGAYGTQGVYSSYIGRARFEAPKDDVVRIVTSEPIADLLDLLSEMSIGPRDELDKIPDEYIGTGQYLIGSKHRGELLLERNRDYWGRMAYSDEVRFIEVPESKARSEMVLDREVDIGALIEYSDTRIHENSHRSFIKSLKSSLCIIFLINMLEGPCRDRRVRQALNYGLDVDSIVREVKVGAATPLNGYLTPHHFGYNPETNPYPYNPEKAESLLNESGYVEGLKLTVDIPTSMPDEAPQLGEIMKEQYSKIGINIDLEFYRDRPAYAEMVREKRINDLCCFDSSPLSTFRVLREKIHSRHRGSWWQGYNNAEVNRLIDQAQSTFDDNRRKILYKKIFQIIRDDAPWIFLYRPTFYWAVSNKMDNWKPFTNGLLRLTD